MTAPRLEVRLDRVAHNARSLVDRLAGRGIEVTAVTKVVGGSVAVAQTLVRAGAERLGDSRIESIEALRRAGVTTPFTLLRSPMLSEVQSVVAHAEVSLNTELVVLDALSSEATRQGRRHGVVLMVELGDLREGLMPDDLCAAARHASDLPGIDLCGIGTNLACQSGVAPDAENMAELSGLVADVENSLGLRLALVSGGNSAALGWALSGADVGRVDDLRLGESVMLGRDPLTRTPIEGLRTDAFTLVGEVIEAKVKPSKAWGRVHQSAFGAVSATADTGSGGRAIVAIGRQDIDPDDVTCIEPGDLRVLGASSDHLVLETGSAALSVGSEVRFALGYSALLRATTSRFVELVLLGDRATV